MSASDQWAAEFYGYQSTLQAGQDGYYSGYYIGTFQGNDKEEIASALLDIYLGGSNTYTFYKVENGSGTNGPIDVTTNDKKDLKNGTWSINEFFNQNFYTVKGGNEFALYYLPSASSDGYWTTANLINGGGNHPNISHLNGISSATPGFAPSSSAVPEPTAVLLFGVGLIGLAGLSRKR